MSSKFLSLVGLKESIGAANPTKAREIIENTCKYFDQDLTSAELALAIEVLLDDQNGALAFINKSIKENKRFSTSNIAIFELWAKLIQNYAKEVNFDAYIETIIEVCMRYALSTAVAAKEKESAMVVLQGLFQNDLMRESDASSLVTKLIAILSQKIKQSTFLQEVFKLLGIIARDSPSSIIGATDSKSMQDLFLKPLETILLNVETIQFNTLTGALEGLNLYLINFPLSPEDDSDVCQRVYICFKRLSDPMDSSKKTTFRASIDLFTAHATLFGPLIFKDAKYWHLCLTKWTSSSIYDDRRKGIYATHAFHQVIASEISKRKDDNDREILRFFLNYFREILESQNSPSHLSRIGIRGFGLMSGPCKQLLPELLDKMMLLVIQRTELASIVEDNELRDTLEHFPDYVEALSQIILITDDKQVMEMLMQNVELIAVRLIKDFHYLSRAHTQLVVSSLLKAFSNLTKVNASLLDSVLERVILSGVIWTCSHKLVFDAQQDWSSNIDWKENITYRSYFPLWEGLIVDAEHFLYNRSLVAEKIFNCLMKSLFVILNKMDFRTKRRVYTDEDGTDKEFHFCDPNIDLCPVKPEDFHIFFNMVAFFRDLFWVKFRSSYFTLWIQEFCSTMLRLAIQYPLVSGFLKLLEVGLVKADFLHYFDDSLLLEVHSLRLHLSHFLKYLIRKCQSISGELQISCLELVLKYPCQFYEDHLIALIPIFEITLDIGKSMIWLAKLAVGALEKMSDLYPENGPGMPKFYRHILPCLDSYLRSKGFEENVNFEIVKIKNKRRIKQAAITKITETELVALQKRIVSLLGKLSPQTATMMILDAKANDDLVKWEMDQRLRVILHFPTMRSSIYLDTIMPRICELALTSSDRKTKVSACELVHAITLYSIGIRRYKGQIWKELCRCMLILGSDSDETVQQMFEPLLKQVMHYMSKNENHEGVKSLMDALTGGISSNSNSSVRDLSAICLREFVEWSIRHVTPDQLAASSGSIATILEHLKICSFDSDGGKRNGAALAFNNLYRILREQETICDRYFIDLFYTFSVNFKLSEELNSTSLVENLNSDLEQVSMSLNHVVRVLRERNDTFNNKNSNRIIPATQEMHTLSDVVVFLINECRTRLISYREKCMEMTNALVTRVSNIRTFSSFVQKYVTLERLQEICEGTIDGSGIRAHSNLDFLKHEKNAPHLMIYIWLQHFLSSLDCYCWLLDMEAIVHPLALFEKANVFKVISYYLRDLCWEEVAGMLDKHDVNSSVGSSDTILQMHAEDVTKIGRTKRLITVRILDFICKTHTAGCADAFPILFWAENKDVLKKFINQIIFEVHKLSFDISAQNIVGKLPKYIEDLMQALQDNCPDREFVGELQVDILENLKLQLDEVHESVEEILNSDSVTEDRKNFIAGIEFVCKGLDIFHANQDIRKFLRNVSMELFSDLYVKLKKMVLRKEFALEPCPSVRKLVNQLMSICLSLNNMAPNVVHCLLDTTVLNTRQATATTTHGEHFFNVYKNSILEYCNVEFLENVISQLMRNITALNFHQILNFFVALIEYLYKHKDKNPTNLKAATDIILANLRNIIQLVTKQNEELTFNKLLAQLVCASPYELHAFREKAPSLEKWILQQLNSDTLSLKTKSNVIHLLPTLVGPDDKDLVELTKALESVQRQYFPLHSAEFAKNSLDETALKYVFKHLLSSMVLSRSYVILEFLIKCTAPDTKHVIEWMIRAALKSYTILLSAEQQSLQLTRILEIVSTREMEPEFRLTILDRFLLTMIPNCAVDSLEEFYVKSIKRIRDMVETNYGSGNSGWIVEHSLVDRIIGFSLIEVMFACLPQEKLCTRESKIGKELLDELKTDKALVGELTKKSFYSRVEVFVTDDPTTRELFRQYQCAAYRSVCSLVSNTQTDLQFYSKFLFEENLAKNELIWKKLIDCTNDNLYNFSGQETEEYLRIKERFVSIRRLNPRATSGHSLPTYSSKQLQTQSVFQSSLSQDVSKLDLNYSTVRTDAEVLARKEKLDETIISVHLERTTLNKHEVMPILCGVVEHMFENDIAPKPPPGSDNRRPYKWIIAIATAMGNSENHRNIRLFLAQLVQNCREVFQHYSYALFCPVLQVLVDECAGTRLNFFTTDIIAMLLSWTSKKLYTPSTLEERTLISQLLKFLMNNVWHEKREIFKFNLELIQSVIHLWKDCILVPSELLLNAIMKSQARDSRENLPGIILLSLVLNNDLDVWTLRSKAIFFRSVSMNLSNDYTGIYQAAANVLGMIISKLQPEEDNELIENRLPELIQKIKSLRKNEKKFLDIVYGIHKHYPEIVDSFREIIVFRIPLAVGSMKCIYLEILLSRVDTYDANDVHNVLVSIGIDSILKTLDYQLLGLHIINRAVRKMEQEDVVKLLAAVEGCIDSSKTECRDVAYEILIYIALNFSVELANRTGQFLINGLMDPATKIQDRIFYFWSKEAKLPSKVEERILFLISDYSVKCEKQCIGFCTQLLLELSIENSESKRQVFEFQDDDDSKLTEYQISTAIKNTNSLPPLFAETHNTRRSFLLGSQSYSYVQDTANGNYFFEPTLDPGKTRTLSKSFSLPSPSGLPFAITPQMLDRNSQKIKSQDTMDDGTLDKSFDRLRKRFLKDKEKETRHRVLQVIDKKMKQQSKVGRGRKEYQVVLYRRYRNGDYPDLLINHLALLMPLQGLVKRDSVIAREVFVLIFSAVLDALGPEANMFIISASSKIQAILANVKTCEPMVFAMFLELALLHPAKFDFPPELIAMLAKATKMQSIGAIYLEKRICVDWETDNLSAKSSSTAPIDEQHWLYLADIYNSLAEYDIVSSIFADKMRTDPRLAEAIEAKANGKYEEAQRLLWAVINRRVEVEHYYSFICYYECFVEMGMWTELSQNIQSQVDDFEELWSEDYNLTFLLPRLMQSELQLILQNQSESNDFLRVLETWSADPVKSDYMKRTFCEELMMLHIANRDFLQARVFGECYLKAFLMDWAVTNSMNKKLRLQNLLNAQKVAEIDHNALLLIDNFSESSVEQLTSRWARCTVGSSESLQFWNCIIAYRTYVGYLIQDLLGNMNSEGVACNQLRDVVFKMHFQLFNTALSQKNSVLSKKILMQLKSRAGDLGNLFNLECEIAQIKQNVGESQLTTQHEQVKTLKQAWEASKNIIGNNENLKNDLSLSLEICKLHSDIGEKLLNLLPTTAMQDELWDSLKRLVVGSLKDIQQHLFNESLHALTLAAETAESSRQDGLKMNFANCLCRIAQFCYDNRKEGITRNFAETDKMIVKYVSLAMKYGSKQACQLFPSILQLKSTPDQDFVTYFKNHFLSVPEWMFLQWIPQILSRVNFRQPSYLDDTVRRIAVAYPNALAYPFNVWYEHHEHKANSNEVLRQGVRDIIDILKSPLFDIFLSNFKILCLPEVMLSHHLEKLIMWISQRREITSTDFHTQIDRLIHAISANSDLQGRKYRSILIYKEQLQNLKTFNVESEFGPIREHIQQIRNKVKDAVRNVDEHMLLESICPWIAKFQWCGEESFLELPGQYEGDCRPNILDHVKIMKFGQRVDVFKSLRSPLRVTIYGSNAKSYDFLVKYGDDLKQDQRIQQLLRLMSSKLSEDQHCRNHNLFIRTFHVTPVAEMCGLLSWVSDTMSLQNFILNEVRRLDAEGIRKVNEANEAYRNFIQNPSKNEIQSLTEVDIYGRAAKHYSRNQLSANLRNLENTINTEIVKCALVYMSVSPESFYTLKNNFATSLTAMNISNWVLGIGDRHLSNILISTKDATLIGIDFGYTFGCGARNLTVPELIPFRLTPHIVGAMNPMGTSGLIFKCMSHVLRVLRSSSHVLMSCMEVFVLEPTVTWLSSVRIQNIDEESDILMTREPRDRIKVVECKLLGHNPMHLLERDLRSGRIARYSDYLDAYVKILRGHNQFNIRARLAEENLSVEQQVKCLIDLATDPAVLGITYEGFLPWL